MTSANWAPPVIDKVHYHSLKYYLVKPIWFYLLNNEFNLILFIIYIVLQTFYAWNIQSILLTYILWLYCESNIVFCVNKQESVATRQFLKCLTLWPQKFHLACLWLSFPANETKLIILKQSFLKRILDELRKKMFQSLWIHQEFYKVVCNHLKCMVAELKLPALFFFALSNIKFKTKRKT